MSDLLVWFSLLMCWIVIDWTAVISKKLSFWVCWDFFFTGAVATRLYLTILEVM